jgi:DNA-binding FadR family transcriptional regulator
VSQYRQSQEGPEQDQAGAVVPVARSLFASIVGESLQQRKSSCRIADHVEEDLIRKGWPEGLIYGSERELSERFSVGRAVIREAVRVLEVRGVARMRRGPKGGLRVLSPGRDSTVAHAMGYVLLLGPTVAQLAEARALVERVRAQLRSHLAVDEFESADEIRRIETVALAFFDALLAAADRVVTGEVLSGRRPLRDALPLFQRSRAGQVAQRMMLECSPGDWTQGRRLGSAFDLAERYGVDRGVVRQAIRILESAGTAVATCGRGHGVVSQAPGRAPVCRLIHCHFAAHGFSAGASMELFHWLSVSAVGNLARQVTASDIRRIDTALDRLANASESGRAKALFDVEESQFSLTRNPIVDMLLGCTKAYPSWSIVERTPQPLLDQVYFTETRKVVAALAQSDPAGASLAQDLKCRRLAEISGHPQLRRAAGHQCDYS